MPVPLVLVHSPLVGPAAWEPVAAVLAGQGHEVTVPDLTGTLTAGPPYCSRQAGVIARSAPAGPVMLIGHSGAGTLLAGAGSMLDRVQGYIFADAGLPIPGRSWLETMPAELAAQVREMADPEGWLPPWSDWWGDDELAGLLPDPGIRQRFAAGCPRLPLAMFGERHSPADLAAPAGYLRLSEAYDGEAARARSLGWPVIEQASHHLGLLTDPGLVADSLLELLRYLHDTAPSGRPGQERMQ
ncbi:MAG TPA: alpha/beta hydrolase [Streptosporangiaceae bacterium]|nr:alpha/beta hydrolase [Streptosporangiaceae bacterium]